MTVQALLRLLSLLVGLGVVGAVHVYLFRRLIRDVVGSRPLRWGLVGGMGGLSACAVMVRPLARLGLQGQWQWVATSLLVWVGVLLYLLMFTLLLDLARWGSTRLQKAPAAVSEERRRFLSRALAVGSSVAAGGVAGYGTWRAFHPPQVTELPLRLAGFPPQLDGLTLVHLTDIHVGPIIQRRFMDELVRQVDLLKPDLVAITGDLVDGSVAALGAHVAALSDLKTRWGSYFVTGNHDYYSGADPWVKALESMGVTCLRNRFVTVGDQASFDLIGVDDWSAARWGRGYDLERAVEGRDPSRASVLLAHQPSNFDQVAARGIGLQLSGHTHGGQMFPGNAAAWAIWKERVAGLSRQGDSFLYTSRGCGFVGPPMRVGAPPEIVKVVLSPA